MSRRVYPHFVRLNAVLIHSLVPLAVRRHVRFSVKGVGSCIVRQDRGSNGWLLLRHTRRSCDREIDDKVSSRSLRLERILRLATNSIGRSFPKPLSMYCFWLQGASATAGVVRHKGLLTSGVTIGRPSAFLRKELVPCSSRL